MKHLKALIAITLAAALLPSALAQTMPEMPTQKMPPIGKGDPKKQAMPISHGGNMGAGGMAGMAGMKPGMAGISMTNAMKSTTDLSDPMSKEGSGTSWLPASSPMYGYSEMRDGNMLMLHGVISPRYVNVGSRRGDRRFDAPSWLMGMFSHPVDSKSQLGLTLMLSFDPLIEGSGGYPLLYQTGETNHGVPLHDHQHPHDLVSELALSYSRQLGGGNSAYLYVADPGEPALGPPTFMHRILAYDYMPAPIGHHWQDATHIQFGVATAGVNVGGKLKIEGSKFTGRDPNEDRYNFDKPRFDSESARLSYNPDADNAYQVSTGFIYSPDGDNVNQHRTTASWLYNNPLKGDANFTTALVFGQNDETQGYGKTNSYLAEADYQRGANTVFGRIENIQKTGKDLFLSDDRQYSKYTLGAYTAGYIHDLTHGKGVDTGLGFAITADTNPSSLNSYYGSGTHPGFEIFFRIRPSRMGGGDGSVNMRGMNMGGMNMHGMSHTNTGGTA